MVQEETSKFVGQKKAKSLIHEWKSRNTFPHFLLVVGEEGSGRRSISAEIAKSIGCKMITVEDLSVDSIREILNSAYLLDSKLMYVIPNADRMSISAKNTLLKFTEEPPSNAYIIITLLSLDNTLPTLVSRSQHLVLEPYTKEELMQLTTNNKYAAVATTPGMIKYFEAIGEDKLVDVVKFCDMVFTKIDKVSLANSFKSSIRIKFKQKDEGFSINTFLATMDFVIDKQMSRAVSRADYIRLSCWLKLLPKYKFLFSKIGMNQRAIYDKMILEIREMLINRGA